MEKTKTKRIENRDQRRTKVHYRNRMPSEGNKTIHRKQKKIAKKVEFAGDRGVHGSRKTLKTQIMRIS